MRKIDDPDFFAKEGWRPPPEQTPREFLDHIARPNLQDLRANPGSSRHAYNAVLTADALAAHIYFRLVEIKPSERRKRDDDGYRGSLADDHQAYCLLRDLALALKHGSLRSPTRLVRVSGQMATHQGAFDLEAFDDDAFDAGTLVLVHINDSADPRPVAEVVEEGLAVLDDDMKKHGL